MTNLWVFGDSFADTNASSSDSANWIGQLALSLKCSIKNLSQTGSDIQYSIHQYLQARNEIKPGDTIVFVTTEINRFWFHKDKPSVTRPYNTQEDPTQWKKKLPIDFYDIIYTTQRIDLKLDILQLLYHDLHFLAAQHSVNAVILNAFDLPPHPQPTPPILTGNKALFTISNEEIAGEIMVTRDFRPLHLTEKNHNILANKLTAAVNKKENPDLTTDFQKDIYQPEDFKQRCENERL